MLERREGGREGGREKGRKGERERGREGERERGREGGSNVLCLFTCKSVQYKYYFDLVLSISA